MNEKLVEDIFKAYYSARKNKRNSSSQLKFEMNYEETLLSLARDIDNRTYKIGRSICFMVREPVKREVFAADFRDRVVHHLIYNYISPIFERIFIADTYSCRKGKGTLHGVDRLEHHILSCSNNYTKQVYTLKLDIKGYFMNINRERLYEQIISVLKKYIGKVDLDYDLIFYLLEVVVFNDPTEDCLIKGRKSDWDDLPASKSLFTTPKGCGLPIGNLTSQLFNNVCLTALDNYIKRDLKEKHYGRYVDDFYIINESPEKLKEDVRLIRIFLKDKLGLDLHPNKIYLQKVEKGMSYLGAIVKPHRRYIRNRTKNKFVKATKTIKMQIDRGNLEDIDKDYVLSSVNSMLGLMRQYKTYKMRKQILTIPFEKIGFSTCNPNKLTIDNENAPKGVATQNIFLKHD